MKKLYLGICLFLLSFCGQSQNNIKPPEIYFTQDLEGFQKLDAFKNALKGVKIIGIGENTHGLGAVFARKVELVKFLHQEMGFDILLMESGFADGLLSWYALDELSTSEYKKAFTSYDFYRCQEMHPLYQYVKEQHQKERPLFMAGIDGQPQQDYLQSRLKQFYQVYDTSMVTRIGKEFSEFNYLYVYERDKDEEKFLRQAAQFETFMVDLKKSLLALKNEKNQWEVGCYLDMLRIFASTYKDMQPGDMAYPKGLARRDRQMYEAVRWFEKKYPDKKIMVWAQNSHVENQKTGEDPVKWMGHYLKEHYKEAYYSIGGSVYQGRDLFHWNNQVDEFMYDSADHTAFHLEA
ncbi:MAG: erythromycin esterase family protein, partial [Bacteroidota bacterium]